MGETHFPLGARPLPILLIFVALLVVLDLVLVRWLKLGKVAWKRVDYAWLAVAALGLLASSVEARRLIAELSIPARADDKEYAYEQVLRYVTHLQSGAVCRTFVRTEFSPPNLASMQREYDAVCAHGRRLARALPAKAPEGLDGGVFGGRPAVEDSLLKRHYAELDSSRSGFTAAVREYDRTVALSKRSNVHITLALLSPILLAGALALRITKVTGEIQLDKMAEVPAKDHVNIGAHEGDGTTDTAEATDPTAAPRNDS